MLSFTLHFTHPPTPSFSTYLSLSLSHTALVSLSLPPFPSHPPTPFPISLSLCHFLSHPLSFPSLPLLLLVLGDDAVLALPPVACVELSMHLAVVMLPVQWPMQGPVQGAMQGAVQGRVPSQTRRAVAVA